MVACREAIRVKSPNVAHIGKYIAQRRIDCIISRFLSVWIPGTPFWPRPCGCPRGTGVALSPLVRSFDGLRGQMTRWWMRRDRQGSVRGAGCQGKKGCPGGLDQPVLALPAGFNHGGFAGVRGRTRLLSCVNRPCVAAGTTRFRVSKWAAHSGLVVFFGRRVSSRALPEIPYSGASRAFSARGYRRLAAREGPITRAAHNLFRLRRLRIESPRAATARPRIGAPMNPSARVIIRAGLLRVGHSLDAGLPTRRQNGIARPLGSAARHHVPHAPRTRSVCRAGRHHAQAAPARLCRRAHRPA